MVRPPTDPGDERVVLRLLEEAVELDGPELERLLDERCGRDTALRLRLERLLDLERRGRLAPPPGLPGVETIVAADGAGARFGPQPGERIGVYRLVERLGVGGMGEVWRARRDDGQFEREVAIKFVRSGTPQRDLVKRFERERALLARLRHPGIATLLDGGVQDGVPYLVMELVEGAPITEHAHARGLSVDERLALFLDVARAVQHAHESLVVHRDLKPGNVLVQDDGRVVLLDFGIAKLLDDAGNGDLTRPSERVLTPRYASPEQLAGQPVTPASDVWALGVLLYELLTGRHPWEDPLAAGRDLRELVGVVEPEPPSAAALRSGAADATRRAALLRGDLDTIVHKALHADVARRYRTVESLVEDLERRRDGRPVLARPDTWSYRATKFARRHRLPLAAAVAVLVTLLGALVWTLHLLERATSADRRAEREVELQARLLAHLEDSLQLSHPELVQSRLRRAGREEALADLERELDDVGARYADAPRLEGRLRAKAGLLLFKLGRVEAAERNAERALELLGGALPADDPELLGAQRVRCELLRLRGRGEEAVEGLRGVLARVAPGTTEADELAFETRSSLAAALQAVDRLREARDELEALRPLAERLHGPRSPAALALRTRLAGVLNSLGDPAHAEAEARAALDGLLAAVGPDHLLVAEARRLLARIHVQERRIPEAEAELERALPVLEAWVVDDDPLLAWTRVDQARVLQHQGRLDEAQALLERASADLERTLGSRNRALLDARLLEATIAGARGRVGVALEAVDGLIADLEGLPDLRETALWFSALHARASFLVQSGRWAEAEALFRSFVDARVRVQGPTHYQSLASQDGLAQCLIARGANADAVEILREVVRRSAEGGSEGYWTLSWRGRLAYALWLRQDFAGCEAVVGPLLPDYEALPGHEAIQEYVVALDLMAACREHAGDPAEALALFERSIALREQAGAGGRWDTLLALSGMARVLAALGRHSEAERALRTLVARAPSAAQVRDENRLQWRLQWAEAVVRAGDVEDAREVLEDIAARVEERLGVDSDEALWCRGLLGVHLARAGAPEEAAWLLEEARERLVDVAGAEHARTRLLTEALAAVYRARGEPEAAEALGGGSR